jgi:hypothetical protein
MSVKTKKLRERSEKRLFMFEQPPKGSTKLILSPRLRLPTAFALSFTVLRQSFATARTVAKALAKVSFAASSGKPNNNLGRTSKPKNPDMSDGEYGFFC